VEDGDLIEIDVPAGRLNLLVPEEELARRRAAWSARGGPPPKATGGYLDLYRRLVSSASRGAYLRFDS
jgi:dihydroxy-acid dehydratase